MKGTKKLHYETIRNELKKKQQWSRSCGLWAKLLCSISFPWIFFSELYLNIYVNVKLYWEEVVKTFIWDELLIKNELFQYNYLVVFISKREIKWTVLLHDSFNLISNIQISSYVEAITSISQLHCGLLPIYL